MPSWQAKAGSCLLPTCAGRSRPPVVFVQEYMNASDTFHHPSSPTDNSSSSNNHSDQPAIISNQLLPSLTLPVTSKPKSRCLSLLREFSLSSVLSLSAALLREHTIRFARSARKSHDTRYVLLTTRNHSDICKIIIAIFLPPVGVFLERGCGSDLLINIVLTILGYIPGKVREGRS